MRSLARYARVSAEALARHQAENAMLRRQIGPGDVVEAEVIEEAG